MSVRTRLERVERLARTCLTHAGEVLVAAWRKMPEAELTVLAPLGDVPAMKAADTTAERLWPATAEYHEALAERCAQLDPLPYPSDAAILEALEVLDSSAAPGGEHDAWMIARMAARLTLSVRDAY